MELGTHRWTERLSSWEWGAPVDVTVNTCVWLLRLRAPLPWYISTCTPWCYLSRFVPYNKTDSISLAFWRNSFFLAILKHMEFPGQGSDLSCSCDLSHSCSNTGSLTHCARPRIEPVFQSSQDTASPIVPQGDFLGESLYGVRVTSVHCFGHRWIRFSRTSWKYDIKGVMFGSSEPLWGLWEFFLHQDWDGTLPPKAELGKTTLAFGRTLSVTLLVVI